MNKVPLLLCLCAALAAPVFADPADSTSRQDRERLEQTLAAEQFWAQPPKTPWTAREAAIFSEIAASASEPAVRLRARKILIDLAGNGRATAEQLPMVAAAFRHLERNAAQPAIARLLAGPGLTHYTVSTKGDGSRWVLVESTAPESNRGGINLRLNAEGTEILLMEAWGGIASN